MSHLNREQRYTISVMYQNKFTQKEIAKAIGKDKSVVSREISRNKSTKGRYSFSYAEMCVKLKKERYKKERKFTHSVQATVDKYLNKHWSPEQIVGYCKKNNISIVSVERIYQYIRKDKINGGDLYKLCRHRLKHRKRPVGKSSPIKDRVSIDERPVEANGSRFGDWEMDLIVGPNNQDAMLTLVERSTGFSLIDKLPYGKNAKELSKVVVRNLFPYIGTIKTITTDNGKEFADHKYIAKKLKTKIYFAHPYSSWEKGLIEYTNKLYRQFIPKKINFKEYNIQTIKEIQYKINARPRKKLDYISPTEKFFVILNEISCI